MTIPVAWLLRAWLVVEVLFGVVSVISVGFAPANTKANFAWPIQPVVMAAVLGAFYISTAPLFLLAVFAKRWQMIRVMILPSALFSTVQLVVTFLHWQKFSLGTIPFYVWFASYILPPPIFVAAYWWHQRQAGPSSGFSSSGFSSAGSSSAGLNDDPLPLWLQRIFLICGVGLTTMAIVVFVFPNLLIPYFPWKLTPLTGRSLCGWLIAVGTLMLSVLRENDWTRARLASALLIPILPALLVQMARFSDQVDWSNPVLWAGLLLFGVIGVCGLQLARGSWRDALN
jgi:hypothetical protein